MYGDNPRGGWEGVGIFEEIVHLAKVEGVTHTLRARLSSNKKVMLLSNLSLSRLQGVIIPLNGRFSSYKKHKLHGFTSPTRMPNFKNKKLLFFEIFKDISHLQNKTVTSQNFSF